MSTTPQMSHMGQQQGQQFPGTSPYQQQPFGQQQGYGPQGPGQQQPYGMGGSLEQLQQLGQQQPFQQLLQQLGQHQGDQQQQQVEQQVMQLVQQVTQAAIQQVTQQVQSQALQAGVANGYIDIVQPLPGQPQQLFLRFPNNVFRVLNHPNPQTHDEVQEAFAFGHQVIGVWDSGSPQILRSIQIRKL
ncbi:hypothetical protein ACFZBP_31590 [Streptomyces sp. NPDC008086]|uniref:hypothetical protein n=1 Tax=unclassified Streptomyces TaxID=2593676 RepID=UPI0036D06E95